MRQIPKVGAIGLLLVLGFETVAAAMGGMGGPSDAWGSPYVLIAPQSFPSPSGTGQKSGSNPQANQAPTNSHPAPPAHKRKRPAH